MRVILTLLPLLLLAACAAPVAREPGTSSIPAVGEIDIHCTETDPHPIAVGITADYDVTYEQVMTWFCSGFSFENILIALQTAEATGYEPGVLLEMLLDKDWEQVWSEIGLTQ
jgi:hypothetical protein